MVILLGFRMLIVGDSVANVVVMVGWWWFVFCTYRIRRLDFEQFSARMGARRAHFHITMHILAIVGRP